MASPLVSLTSSFRTLIIKLRARAMSYELSGLAAHRLKASLKLKTRTITVKNKVKQTMFTLNCKARLLTLDSPVVMGIINVTPDSFYKGSRQSTVDAALQKAEQMINEGATILDIGGQSTRPDSRQISSEEEIDRALPVIEAIH